MRIIIVYDSDHPGAIQNKCFSDDYATQGPGHRFTVELAKKASSKGYDIVTSDVFLSSHHNPQATVLCITEMQSSRTNELLRKGVIPFLCYSTESPIIARGFYINIKKIAGRYIHNIQFRGTQERLATTRTHFEPMYYPMDKRIPLPYNNWETRQLLVLINRNKRMFYRSFASIKDITRSALSPIKIQIQKLMDPWIRSREIYKDRIEAIFHFHRNKGFHLYGEGWDTRIPGYPEAYQMAAQKSYNGKLGPQDKHAVMNQYKFSLCFENCVFPGYITEKIFDSLLSGCIPVYFGAPDIKDFVPADLFVDYTKFRNLSELEEYLIEMQQREAFKMLDAGRKFLASSSFDKYFCENIVDGIIQRIQTYTTN